MSNFNPNISQQYNLSSMYMGTQTNQINPSYNIQPQLTTAQQYGPSSVYMGPRIQQTGSCPQVYTNYAGTSIQPQPRMFVSPSGQSRVTVFDPITGQYHDLPTTRTSTRTGQGYIPLNFNS